MSMNFGVDILPTSDGNKTLGNTATRWKVYGSLFGKSNVDYGETLPESGSTGQVFFQVSPGATGYEIPTGGTTGQALVKHSNTDRDIQWGTIYGLPTGGTAGQALIKNSATNGDVVWNTLNTVPSGGSEGQALVKGSTGYAWTSISTVPSGGTAGQALVKNSQNTGFTWGDVGGVQTPDNSTKYYVSGSSSNQENTNAAIFNTNVYVQSNVLYGACWNDYAEYRQTNEPIEGGRCIVENGDGTLSLSTKRMQGGAEIVSDTFGFAIGETAVCKTPIAVSGRVLAYGDKSANEFTIGAPVCSGENGTISEMTEEEARNYPWLILGTVSAIPQEETWGTNNVKVNGRVWIRVR